MYSDPIVVAGILAILGTALAGAGFFVYIWMDSDQPDQDDQPGSHANH